MEYNCKAMNIPEEAKKVIKDLERGGFEGYLVGGCVRDLLRGEDPEDFDVATNATPEEMKKIFKNSFSNNVFGTVTVLTGSKKDNVKEIQVTTYRTEEDYNDKRHPEKVSFVKDIKEDLQRRDFTINAMALREEKGDYKIIYPFKGKSALE